MYAGTRNKLCWVCQTCIASSSLIEYTVTAQSLPLASNTCCCLCRHSAIIERCDVGCKSCPLSSPSLLCLRCQLRHVFEHWMLPECHSTLSLDCRFCALLICLDILCACLLYPVLACQPLMFSRKNKALAYLCHSMRTGSIA